MGGASDTIKSMLGEPEGETYTVLPKDDFTSRQVAADWAVLSISLQIYGWGWAEAKTGT